MKDEPRVIIVSRTSDLDLSSHILERGSRFERLVIPLPGERVMLASDADPRCGCIIDVDAYFTVPHDALSQYRVSIEEEKLWFDMRRAVLGIPRKLVR